ncbi:hypothetical protein OKW30_007956 [Paraburkholderia sp. Clong3]
MNLTKIIVRIALVVSAALGSHAAMAGPVRCSVNNQDSTCVGHITTAWQTAPTCPTDAGWTTIAAARWIGSQYTAPQCNFQVKPTCPTGYDQTSAPAWNGSSWSAPGCSLPPFTPPPTQTPDPASTCNAYAASMGYPENWTHADGVPDPRMGTEFANETTNQAWGQGGLITTVICGANNGVITYWAVLTATGGDGG